MREFFYIIHRDGQIFEIENLGDRFEQSMKQWKDGGMLVFPSMGLGLNTVDISKILNAEKYDAYIDSASIRKYIKNGAWYDTKEKKVIRYEKWREDELKAKEVMQIEGGTTQRNQADISAWLKKYKPDCVKEYEALVNKMTIRG